MIQDARSVPVSAYLICLLILIGSCVSQDLSGLSSDDRQSVEIACVVAKGNGPASYHDCLNTQLRKLGSDTAPDLSGLSWDDHESIEIACVVAKGNGPASYHACLNAQLAKLNGIQISNVSELSLDDRQSIELACVVAKGEGPATFHSCLNAQLHAVEVTRAVLSPANRSSIGVRNTEQPQRATEVPQQYPFCAENGSCYGDISESTGLPKTIHVHGYYRSNGTYVRGYYRSK